MMFARCSVSRRQRRPTQPAANHSDFNGTVQETHEFTNANIDDPNDPIAAPSVSDAPQSM
jgi:hypothetical protein